MRRIAAFVMSLFAFAAQPVAAQAIVYQVVEEEVVWLDEGGDRFVAAEPVQVPHALAAYGPFRVLDPARAALVDVTDGRSLTQFKAMLRDFPGIATIEMIDCPGTEDDRANMRIGREIRAWGIATHVPAGGSVRSGAVELFLAGARRMIDDGAEFAVHSWIDEDGRQADDYPANAPENLEYLAYYREMGMSPAQASAFYAMTNSAPFEDALWIDAAGMRGWAQAAPSGEDRKEPGPALANLDLMPGLH